MQDDAAWQTEDFFICFDLALTRDRRFLLEPDTSAPQASRRNVLYVHVR